MKSTPLLFNGILEYSVTKIKGNEEAVDIGCKMVH
jgi:hypothetical protein